jgi:hypothetical protein
MNEHTVNIEYLGMDPEGRWMVNASLSTGENIQDQVRANLAPLTK